MRASVDAGGKSLSQYSQFGRSCSAMTLSYQSCLVSEPPRPDGPEAPPPLHAAFGDAILCLTIGEQGSDALLVVRYRNRCPRVPRCDGALHGVQRGRRGCRAGTTFVLQSVQGAGAASSSPAS